MRYRPLPGLIVLLALLAPATVRAQFTDPPPPTAYALKGITLVRADGSKLEGQTLIVRAGRIEALAAGAAIPADARVLDGDTLYVYPGIVDAAGAIAFEFPRDTTDRSQVRSWNPPRTLQGFMPSRRVLDYMTAKGSNTAALRKQGVVAVAAHPGLTEPLMPGRGVFALLRPNAPGRDQLVLVPELPPLFTLRGGRGVYPSTGMGVAAWYRQTFLDAQRLTAIASAEATAGPVLKFDADMAIVQDLLRTRGRVFFVANDANEIRHVFALADEFGFRPVIVGGSEAWQVADELKRRDVAVLVSVDFEKPERWKPKARKDSAAAEPDSADAQPDSARAAQPDSTAQQEEKPLDPGAAREKARLEEAYANAGKLAAAGVTFALVSGAEDGFRDGILKTIEYGLSETAALRAITQTPATLLGLPQLASVQQGAAATFVVTDKPLFTKDARVLYTFVEGVLERGSDPKKAAAADSTGETANAAGTWTVQIIGPESQTVTMTLTQNGIELSGTMESQMGSLPVSGTITGSAMTIRGTLQAGGQSVELTIKGTINGDEASGQVESSFGNFEWTGRRTGPGGRS